MTEAGMAIMVIVIGGLLVVAGIGLIAVLLKEKTWWERLLMGMLGMPPPEIGGNLGSMMPMMQEMIKGLMKRVFNIIKFAALLGGAGVSSIGVVLILIGIYIWS
ncbi:hypothetical protein ACFLT3_00450 [Chloroflexota bacterium]